ncbi:MAG: hypothetical protein ACREE2_14320 [Stellaceae bacterium]
MDGRRELTPEECARITELQGFLAELLVEHREATEGGEEDCAQQLQAEIDCLLREKEEIEKWVTMGSAPSFGPTAAPP